MKKILLIIIVFLTMSSVSQTLDSSFVYSVPNAFTPNSDGLNDKFVPYVDNASYYSFKVIDRNATILYKGNEFWDGGTSCPGVYIWELIIVDLWNREHRFFGHLILIK